MLILGIDDAGRGPLIGPMILAGVLVTKTQDSYLKTKGVKDSKQIVHKIRKELAEIIHSNSEGYFVVQATPESIDSSISSGINLNTLEAMEAAKIINKLNKKSEKIQVIIDCPSVNTSSWRLKVLEFVDHSENLDLICEHKADVNHPSVSAASILAKVAREEEVEKIKKKYGDIGSGYPSDPYTIDFLKKKGKDLSDSGIFRKSWSTWKTLFAEKDQKTLKDF